MSEASGLALNRASDLVVEILDDLIHLLRRTIRSGAIRQVSRYANCGATWRYRLQDHRPRSDARVLANLDVAEHLGAHRQQHAAPHFRMPVALLFARATESYAVQHRDIVFDDCCFADHSAGRVVNHETLAETSRRMDVNAEQF